MGATVFSVNCELRRSRSAELRERLAVRSGRCGILLTKSLVGGVGGWLPRLEAGGRGTGLDIKAIVSSGSMLGESTGDGWFNDGGCGGGVTGGRGKDRSWSNVSGLQKREGGRSVSASG